MSKSRFEAIIFDLDGTLIDTETPDFEACQMLYGELGLTLNIDQWAQTIIGRLDAYDNLFDDLLQHSNDGLTKSDLRRRLHELWAITLQNVQLMPGAERLISDLHQAGYPMGIATASDTQWATRWLTRFDLWSYFQVVASKDHVSHTKPAPDLFLLAAAQLGVEPEHCLVFEDSLVGVQAARAANMTVVAVPSHITRTLDFSQADEIAFGLEHIDLMWLDTLARKRMAKSV
jgi:HAD superfamily hydrolase (TIGR01509 family)